MNPQNAVLFDNSSWNPEVCEKFISEKTKWVSNFVAENRQSYYNTENGNLHQLKAEINDIEFKQLKGYWTDINFRRKVYSGEYKPDNVSNDDRFKKSEIWNITDNSFEAYYRIGMPLMSDREDCFKIQYSSDDTSFTIIKVGIDSDK